MVIPIAMKNKNQGLDCCWGALPELPNIEFIDSAAAAKYVVSVFWVFGNTFDV